MWRRILRTCFWSALGCAPILGCEALFPRPPYPQDPLLLSKKPVEGKPDRTEPVRLAYTEPMPPPLPAVALVSKQPASPILSTPRTLAAATGAPQLAAPPQDLNISQPSPLAQPPERLSDSAVVQAIPVSRQKPSVDYDYAADYSWLQGVLERANPGQLSLRFCKSAAEDKWGGRFVLGEDARLVQLRPGDVVRVDGELLIHEEATPSYRIREVWLVKRGE
jgi:hypothetical protein